MLKCYKQRARRSRGAINFEFILLCGLVALGVAVFLNPFATKYVGASLTTIGGNLGCWVRNQAACGGTATDTENLARAGEGPITAPTAGVPSYDDAILRSLRAMRADEVQTVPDPPPNSQPIPERADADEAARQVTYAILKGIAASRAEREANGGAYSGILTAENGDGWIKSLKDLQDVPNDPPISQFDWDLWVKRVETLDPDDLARLLEATGEIYRADLELFAKNSPLPETEWPAQVLKRNFPAFRTILTEIVKNSRQQKEVKARCDENEDGCVRVGGIAYRFGEEGAGFKPYTYALTDAGPEITPDNLEAFLDELGFEDIEIIPPEEAEKIQTESGFPFERTRSGQWLVFRGTYNNEPIEPVGLRYDPNSNLREDTLQQGDVVLRLSGISSVESYRSYATREKWDTEFQRRMTEFGAWSCDAGGCQCQSDECALLDDGTARRLLP